MKLPRNRWKPAANGLLLPEDFQADKDDGLDDILLRLPCFEPAGVELSLRVRDALRGVLIVGASGSGKTTLLNRLWSDLIGHRSSRTGRPVGLLILDCQGGYAVDHVRQLAEQSGRSGDVVVLSRTEGYFDPMADLIDFATLDVATSKLISATAFYGSNHNDIYWSENSRALLSSILTLLLVVDQEVTIWRVIDAVSEFFLQAAWSEKTEQRLKQFHAIVARALPGLSPGIGSKLKFATETLLGWKKLDYKTKTILSSCLGITIAPFVAASALPYWDATKGNRIDPAAALDGKIVVVSLPGATEPETAGLLCRLIKMEFYRAAQSRRSLGDQTLTGLIMDEYHLAVTRGSARWADATHLATLRGKGVFTIAATQGLGQLDQIIGPAATESLLINYSNLIFMRSQEMGRLYALAERLLGHRRARLDPARGFDGNGNLMMSLPSWLIPPEPVCPPGTLARLDTHQAYVLLANGFRTEEPVWLAPLFLQDPPATEEAAFDMDLEVLRRAESDLQNKVPSTPAEKTYYSLSLWEFLLNVAPRQTKSIRCMTLGEFKLSLQGVGRYPDGIATIPPAWRMACFHLARRLPLAIRLAKLGAQDGKLDVAFMAWSSKSTSLEDLLKLEAKWKRSVYPTPLRPLHARDKRWLEENYPHLCAEIVETKK